VEYSINTGSDTLGPYGYDVVSDTGNPVLVLAAEDYTGDYPTYIDTTAPNFLDFYTDALDAGSYAYDVYDVDAQGLPPSYAEVLSHYDAVIWYTGNDYAASVPYLGVQEEEVLDVRDFINYNDGKLLATGQDFAKISTYYGYFSDDFYQYYLGANLPIEGGGMDSAGAIDVIGETGDPIFDALSFSIQGGDGADNQLSADSFVPTSEELPHYVSTIAAWYDRPGIFDPHSGEYYVYSQQADESFKRLGNTFTLPAGSPALKFWVSFDIEDYWDYAFVEISVVGSDVWTTLPDLGGLSTTDTGDSCASGWVDQIHPFLAHYMDADCNPVGTTGTWNAFTGRSGGWQQLEFDLSTYAGQTVELYISYASDWGTQNLGAFIDDIDLSGYGLEDFETGMGVWETSTAPGSEALNNWIRRMSFNLPEGPVIRTPGTVYMGFGFEAIDNADDRNALMDSAMKYLGQ
jgi:hypothetical protein